MDEIPPLHPPERLLCGPGPANVEPAVIEAMNRPMLGHLDPVLHAGLLEVVSMLRETWRMPDGLVLPLHCTGTAGMETGIANLLEPGDTAIVAQCGYFGGRGAPARRARRGHAWPRHAPDGRLRDLARRRSAGYRGMGRRLRLLLHPEVPGRAAGNVAAGGVGASDGAHPDARHTGAVLVRPAAAGALLDREPGRLPPHGADPGDLRVARGAPPGPRRGPGGTLGAACGDCGAPAEGARDPWPRGAGGARPPPW